MKLDFMKEIKGDLVKFELLVELPNIEDCIKMSMMTGYKCTSVTVNNEEMKNPSFVRCYSIGGQNNEPVLGFKFSSAKWMKNKFNFEEKDPSLYITIPQQKKKDFVEMMDTLECQRQKLCIEADWQREKNDSNICMDDRIHLSYSPRFISVNYPFDSNQEKTESKIWSKFDGDFELADWIEERLDLFFIGLGCGCSKKYEMSYGEYKEIFENYVERLNKNKR